MKRPAIKDVALRAGVSRAAVSKVINDAYGTSDAMRRKVEAAMEELNYRPSPGARGLRGKTYTLGVLMPSIRSWFFPDILAGVTKQLAGTRYHALLGAGQDEVNSEHELVETMLDRSMDGVILISPRLEEDYVRHIAQAVPNVFVGRHQKGLGFDTVNNDDERGAWIAVEHLAKLGHQRIAHVTQEEYREGDHTPPSKRLRGYLAAMKQLDLERHTQIVLGGLRHDNYTSILDMLQRPNRPTAIFAWTDTVALQVMSAAEEMGLKVPDDLSLVGYDNSDICAMPRIMLTSIDQSARNLGEMAARLLIERIDGRKEEVHFVTPPRLVIRGSTLANPLPRHR